jgi:two-component system, LytTR family, sensor histidine kinase AlgZ
VNDCTDPTLLPGDKSKATPGLGPFLRRAIWIVSGATLVILLLFLSTGRIRLSQIGIQIFAVLIYSTSIGVPSILILTQVSIRYTSRFPRLNFLIQAFVLVCTATVGTFAGDLLLLAAGIIRPGGYWLELRESLPFSIVITQMIGLSVSTYETLRYKLQAATLELRTRQMEQERANKLLVEARLSSLESRIHPHFLFNTLNSIAALIPSDPGRAEDMVSKLASLLRFSLHANHNSLVPLAQELKLVRDYLEIESTRFGPRLRYEIAVPESLGSVQVPPLALQSLVENSVKHVAAQRSEGATIRVTGFRVNGRMQLEVIDDGPGFSLASISPEHGLGNLSARLQLLFDEAGQLDVARENGKTVARISFPAES